MGGRHPGCSRLLGHSRGPKGSGPNGSPRPNRSWPGLGLALPRRVDPLVREVPLPQAAAGDHFQSPPVLTSRHEGVRLEVELG